LFYFILFCFVLVLFCFLNLFTVIFDDRWKSLCDDTFSIQDIEEGGKHIGAFISVESALVAMFEKYGVAESAAKHNGEQVVYVKNAVDARTIGKVSQVMVGLQFLEQRTVRGTFQQELKKERLQKKISRQSSKVELEDELKRLNSDIQSSRNQRRAEVSELLSQIRDLELERLEHTLEPVSTSEEMIDDQPTGIDDVNWRVIEWCFVC
jgi:hypothetical protein